MFNYNNADNIQICMDVPFVDHPYLIGPRGRKCQHLMDRYKSLIHFPDLNRRSNGPKINNVIINGSSKNAEELRSQLRNRTPIRLAVQLQNFGNPPELASQMERAINERSLPIRISYGDNYNSAMIKTEWRNEETLIAFCNEFLHQPLATFANSGIFTMALTILPIINPWNSEVSHWLIEHIYEETGCRLYYPPKEKFTDQPPSYFVKGDTAAGILKAGKTLLGLTMFQVSFVIPGSSQFSAEKLAYWQREFLVHVSVESVTTNSRFDNNNCGGGDFDSKSNNSSSANGGALQPDGMVGVANHQPRRQHQQNSRAVLRSFEFCLNNVYFVRSLLLGFKKTVQSNCYDFMQDMKPLIPCSVFESAQLHFPLYAIDDERSFNWELAGRDFFQKFYGGPRFSYTGSSSLSPSPMNNHESTSSSLKTINVGLTSRLQALLKINDSSDSVDSNNNYNNYTVSTNANTTTDNSCSFNMSSSCGEVEMARGNRGSPNAYLLSPKLETDMNGLNNSVFLDESSLQIVTNSGEELTGMRGEEKKKKNAEDEFVFLSPRALTTVGKSVETECPSNMEHDDDPELQAILRKTMPCLQVTQQQVDNIDHDALFRSLLTADSLAMFLNPGHQPFNYADYAVSYPNDVNVEEFQRQFKEFIKERNRYVYLRNLTTGNALDNMGVNNNKNALNASPNSDDKLSNEQFRKSASF